MADQRLLDEVGKYIRKKPMASAISSGGTLENFQGKNQDAASFNRFATAPVHCVHGSSLSLSFNAATDIAAFCRLLCTVHGTGWSVFRN